MKRLDPQKRLWRSDESGSVMIFVLVGLVTLIGFTALGIDLGLAYNSRTQAQAAVDARHDDGMGTVSQRMSSGP